MLKPRIKHKITEIEESKNKGPQKSLIFFILFFLIIYVVGSMVNNYFNQKLFVTNNEIKYKNVIFKLETDKDSYFQGEKVIIKLIVINNTGKQIELDFLNSELAYFTVYTYVNLGLTKFYYKVWTTEPSIPEVPKVYKLKLAPGEKLSIVKVWDQVDQKGNPVNTGKYKFMAKLNTIDRVGLVK